MQYVQELVELIEKLDVPAVELDRLVRITSYQPSHSGSKMKCCGVFRCEPCHFDHLRTHHSTCAKFIMRNPAPTGTIYPKPTPGRRTTKRKIKARAKAQANGFISWQDMNDSEQRELYYALKALLKEETV